MTFEFESYILRQPRDDDAQGFFEISHDPEVMQYYGEVGANYATLEEARWQVRWCREQFAAHAGRWVIAEKDRDRDIGDVGFHDFVERHNRVELGYRDKTLAITRMRKRFYIGKILHASENCLTGSEVFMLRMTKETPLYT